MSNTYVEKIISELKDTDLKRFKEQVKLVDDFIVDERCRDAIKLNMVISDEVCNNITDTIAAIDLEKLEVNSLNLELVKLRHLSLKAIKESEKANSIAEKRLVAEKAYVLYEFVNAIVRNSAVRKRIIEMFKEEFGNSYIQKVQLIEDYISPLMRKFKQNEVQALKSKSKAIELYLLLKKWQEDQRKFHNDYLYPWFIKVRQSFNSYFEQNAGEHLLKVSESNRLACLLLDNIPIIPIDTVSRFVLVCRNKDIASIVGYKNMGLAILNNEKLYIPKTYVISVGSLSKGLYVSEIMNLPLERFAVRSSATVEEAKSSFAGMFASALDVEKLSIYGAIGKVHSSVSSKKVKEHVQKYGKEKPHMAVVLQEYLEPKYSGIWIGQNIKGGHLEWTKGNRMSLENEDKPPIYENWNFAEDKIKNKLVFKQIAIGKVCLKLQEMLNSTADFEWCIMDNKLIWLQYNSVTK